MVNKKSLGKYLVIATGVIIVLVVLLIIVMCDGKKVEASNHRMRMLDGKLMYGIYVDGLTGVQYLLSNCGGVCVMVDAEGKPLIWEGAE